MNNVAKGVTALVIVFILRFVVVGAVAYWLWYEIGVDGERSWTNLLLLLIAAILFMKGSGSIKWR